MERLNHSFGAGKDKPKKKPFGVIKSMLLAVSVANAVPAQAETDTASPATEQVDRSGLRGIEIGGSVGFDAIDQEGNAYTNWWRILAPMQMEVGWESDVQRTATIRVPYRYSRQFNSAVAVSAAERQEAARYIEQKMREEFAERMVYWDPTHSTENIYRYEHQGDSPTSINRPTIQRIAIAGVASPEGPESRGSGTIAPGAVDQENINLSEHRASDMDPVVRDALTALGLSPEVVSSISGSEAQFSEEEITQMAAMAERMGITNTGSDLESAYLLIRAYNTGEVTDVAAQQLLDEVVGSKRMVNVEVTYDQEQQVTHVVPLPIVLMLILTSMYPVYRWNKGRKQEGSKEMIRERFSPVSEGDENTEHGDVENWLGERHLDSVTAEDPRFLEVYDKAIADDVPFLQKPHIFERIVVDELNPYLGTKKDDVGYMNIIVNHLRNADRAVNPERFLRVLTLEILRRWQTNDQEVRAGIARKEKRERELARNKNRDFSKLDLSGIHDVRKEYDYWQDPLKVVWAVETAKVLSHLIEAYMNTYAPAKGDVDGVYAELSRIVRSIARDPHLPPARQEENIRKEYVGYNTNRGHIGMEGYEYRKPGKI